MGRDRAPLRRALRNVRRGRLQRSLALAAGKPALIQFVTDPEVPPLPPHIRFEQMKAITSAIRGGDDAAPRFMKESLRGKLAELLTR